jgi:hypothetical protein
LEGVWDKATTQKTLNFETLIFPPCGNSSSIHGYLKNTVVTTVVYIEYRRVKTTWGMSSIVSFIRKNQPGFILFDSFSLFLFFLYKPVTNTRFT